MQSSELDDLVRIGKSLDPVSVQGLEQQLLVNPDDLGLRIQLLVYYSTCLNQLNLYVTHVQHLISRHANDETFADFAIYRSASLKCSNNEVYEQIKGIWLRRLNLPECSIWAAINAATFFQINDEPELAINTLIAHPDLDLSEAALYKVASLLKILAKKNKSEKRLREALTYFRKSLSLATTHKSKILSNIEIASLAGELVDTGTAREHAITALELAATEKGDDVYGYVVHICNILLGNLALAENDAATAMECLSNAANLEPSALLSAKGPDLSLARRLVEREYFDEVVQFLNLISGYDFNETDKNKLSRLKRLVG
ncbi:MAG: hypothetical protein EKK48_15090 [Candidatus Melainabacteria bacterium]|nr:MAG: hypothetical protein EKK48_15090 [Candidatus Melainabacteria bacterium]